MRVIALAYCEVEKEINLLSIESLKGKLGVAERVGMKNPATIKDIEKLSDEEHGTKKKHSIYLKLF